MRVLAALCGGLWGCLALLIIVGVAALNIWNIILMADALGVDEQCNEPLHTFLIGSIVASAVALLAYGGGIGGIYILVWAVLGQIWYNDARYSCASSAPNWLDATRKSLIILWVTVASGFGVLVSVVCAGLFGGLAGR